MEKRFNPCFSGSYSARVWVSDEQITINRVSILVLVEVTLQVRFEKYVRGIVKGFNPCFSGSYSARGYFFPSIRRINVISPSFFEESSADLCILLYKHQRHINFSIKH